MPCYPLDCITTCDTFVGWSDHYAVACNLNIARNYTNKTIEFQKRSMKNFNEAKFREDLQHVPWHTISTIDEMDDRWSTFWSLFKAVVDEHTPIKLVKLRKKLDKPWMTGEIRA